MRKALATATLAILGGAGCAHASSCGEGSPEGVCDASAMVQTRQHKAVQRHVVRQTPATPSVCVPGEHVLCLGTDGNQCAGNQCCPGAGGSPTYPCPSADANFTGCETNTKVVDCLPSAAGANVPSTDTEKTLNSRPYLGTVSSGGAGDTPKGKIKIDVNGVIEEYWLPGANTEDNYTTVKYEPPYRFYLMNKYTTDYGNPDDFVYLPYIGKTFSVDFNLGPNGPGCGCNLNFYLVKMPAATPGKDHDYYCDAQCFEGMGCCPEFDMNEGNLNVMQITNHACTGNYPQDPTWVCNKWGDPEQKTTEYEFSIGAGHTIDSTRPFTWQNEFREENGQAIVTTRIIQGNNVVTKTMGPNSDQLNSMFNDIKDGMAFVTGYWFASDMNWLDGEECGSGPETCNDNPAYLSNWKLYDNGNVPTPVPGPTPSPPAPGPPTPTGGKCCWQTCSSSCGTGLGDWCNASPEQCSACGGGTWCH